MATFCKEMEGQERLGLLLPLVEVVDSNAGLSGTFANALDSVRNWKEGCRLFWFDF